MSIKLDGYEFNKVTLDGVEFDKVTLDGATFFEKTSGSILTVERSISLAKSGFSAGLYGALTNASDLIPNRTVTEFSTVESGNSVDLITAGNTTYIPQITVSLPDVGLSVVMKRSTSNLRFSQATPDRSVGEWLIANPGVSTPIEITIP